MSTGLGGSGHSKPDAKGHFQIYAAELLDYFVCASKQYNWHFEAKRFSSLEVDRELELGGQLYWQLSYIRSPENAVNIPGCLPEQFSVVDTVSDQAT